MEDLPMGGDGEVIPGLVKHLSPSSMSTYLKCPRQWWYAYILGIKIPPGKALVVGNSFHKAAELGMLDKIETGDEPDIDTSADRARDEAKKILDSGNHDVKKADQGQTVDDSVRYAANWAKGPARQVKPIEVEKTFAILMSGVKVTGRIDVVGDDGNPSDWKSSGKTPTPRDLFLAPQTLIYPFALPEAKAMTYRYIIGLKTMVKLQDIVIDGRRLEIARSIAEEQVLDIAEAIRSGVFPRRTEGWHCSPDYCGYYSRCMGGKDKP